MRNFIVLYAVRGLCKHMASIIIVLYTDKVCVCLHMCYYRKCACALFISIF